MSKFLVAGGAGFIGSNIAEALTKQGHFVRVMDNFCSGKEENLAFARSLGQDTCEIMRADIRDKFACDQAVKGMDYVLLLAALRSVPKSMEDPESYNDVNINGTLFMLQACAKNKVKRIVFSSSSSIYGDTDQFPQKETDLPKLISPYALSKLTGEYYCKIFSEFFGVETVCLRYFNVFGPKQALDDEYAVVIPKFIHSILNDQAPPIFGNGKQSRDFTYIDNVVSANILSAVTPGLKHEIFNVANGEDRSVLDLVDTLNKIIGKTIKPEFKPVRPGDVFKTRADISRIRAKTGFEPLVGFEDGLRHTVAYFQKKFGA
ncbi:MAG: LPS biosynthesis protein WbpP [Candidatus Omnitrophica bacterium CG12_big_fil_rev_8_21_14_0_65_50_5]|nr:MAG: LPS biosynthesis protein WbpP [Candidatus Omnitrophica bacterium CG12_big_fil_rev_8_21_14_0_65_50_5]